MSEPMNANGFSAEEQVYPLKAGRLVPRAIGLGIAAIVFGAITYNVLVTERKIVLGLFLAFATLLLVMLVAESVKKMRKENRYALTLSHQGIRTPHARQGKTRAGDPLDGMVPWEDIDRILAVCFRLGGGQSDAVARALGGNTPHVRVIRKTGDLLTVVGPDAGQYHVGFSTELDGGEAAYAQMVRELAEWGAAKGVRVALIADATSRWLDVFPTLPRGELTEFERKDA